jgi:hypothetical protein
MLYMNDYDIMQLAQRYGNHPVLGKAVDFLEAFVFEVNHHSDGWAYWRRPVDAAAKLMTFLQHPGPMPTEADFRKTLTPIKAFYTRHGNAAGMKWPNASERGYKSW